MLRIILMPYHGTFAIIILGCSTDDSHMLRMLNYLIEPTHDIYFLCKINVSVSYVFRFAIVTHTLFCGAECR